MVGGTAIALHIGHRLSLDFDLFTHKKIRPLVAKKAIANFAASEKKLLWESNDQIHYRINSIKFTLFEYPFMIPAQINFEDIIRIPNLKQLAAMKAFALGGRAKWKDYVDLYFILKEHYSLAEVIEESEKLFSTSSFNAKLFIEQLSFFKDINYDEQVDYMPGFEKTEDEIKNFLVEVATQKF